MWTKSIKKYFQSHLAPEAESFSTISTSHPWEYALTVPMMAEADLVCHFLSHLRVAAENASGRVLCIIGINQTTKEGDWTTNNNLKSIEKVLSLADSWEDLETQPQGYLCHIKNLDLLVVNLYEAPYQIVPKKGIGKVRKIINDIAFALIAQGKIHSPWIFNTDADAILPRNYFTLNFPHSNFSAALVRYRHVEPNFLNLSRDNQIAEKAITDYEIQLRYYSLGLRFSQSPYWFPTIGSTIIINAAAYATVRGFPQLSAGEDFYLLNKLAKVGPIFHSSTEIKLLNRESNRVPFGTGVGVAKIEEQLKKGQNHHLYHPGVFWALKFLLEYVTTTICEESNIGFKNFLDQNQMSLENRTKQNLLSFTEKSNIKLQCDLARQRSKQMPMSQFNNWFDAFKTMKFIHFLRDNGLPNIPLDSAINSAPFIPSSAKNQRGIQLLTHLKHAEENSHTSTQFKT